MAKWKNIMTGRDPLAMDTIKLAAMRYCMERKGYGSRAEKAYIAGAVSIITAIGRLPL